MDIHESDNSDEDEEAIFSPDTSHLRTRANPNCRKTTSKKQPQKTSTPSTQQQAQQRPQETQRKHIEAQMDVQSPFCMKDQGTMKVILVQKDSPVRSRT